MSRENAGDFVNSSEVGPYNYAPRESYYIEKIVRYQPVPTPTDADGTFQFAYVKDLGAAIMLCCQCQAARNNAFNLSAPEVVTYISYLDTLRKVSNLPFTTEPLSVEEIYRRQIASFPYAPSGQRAFQRAENHRASGA